MPDLYDRLTQAVRLDGKDAAVAVQASYDPAGGPDTRVFPPTFPLDAADPDKKTPYLFEQRRVGGEVVQSVVLDQPPSQNNRAEEAVAEAVAAGRVTLPYFLIEHQLPTGRTVTVTSFDAPHRAADAYLRDSQLDGTIFDKTAAGARLREATIEDVTPLYEREPLSLIYGMWDSHRKGRQLRLPRLYRSEIFGTAPASGRRAAGKMDPHNLVGAVQDGERATDGSAGWTFVPPEANKAKVKGDKLSEIGHGNIAPGMAHGGVTVADIQRVASLSFAGLARLRFGATPREAADAARVALAAIALLADRLAFARPALWLRSGCELVLRSETVGMQQAGGVLDPLELDVDGLLAVLDSARAAAARGGLVMADDVVRLAPGKALEKAWTYAYLQASGEGE